MIKPLTKKLSLEKEKVENKFYLTLLFSGKPLKKVEVTPEIFYKDIRTKEDTLSLVHHIHTAYIQQHNTAPYSMFEGHKVIYRYGQKYSL